MKTVRRGLIVREDYVDGGSVEYYELTDEDLKALVGGYERAIALAIEVGDAFRIKELAAKQAGWLSVAIDRKKAAEAA